jgi:competence protein ComEA
VEKFLTSSRNKILLLLGIIGLILVAVGFFFFKSGLNFSGTKVEILNSSDFSNSLNSPNSLTVEISGEVVSPGVYKLSVGSRVDDLLVAAGGFSINADRVWTDKYLNRAAKVTDGQKVYIPNVNQQLGASTAKNGGGDQTVSSAFSSDSNVLININTASLSELDSLPGIGQIYGQSIIEHRPYSNVQELVSKGVIKQSLYDKIKDRVSTY